LYSSFESEVDASGEKGKMRGYGKGRKRKRERRMGRGKKTTIQSTPSKKRRGGGDMNTTAGKLVSHGCVRSLKKGPIFPNVSNNY